MALQQQVFLVQCIHCLNSTFLHSSLIQSHSEHLGILVEESLVLFGDFGTDYPNTDQYGDLISCTMNLYSTW